MKKSKDIDTDNLPLETADEENDDELPTLAKWLLEFLGIPRNSQP